MSVKSDDEVERSPKRQKTSGDEADDAESRVDPAEKKDTAGDDGEAKPANAAEDGQGKTGEARKRPRDDVKENAEAMVNKLLERPMVKKADVRGRRVLGGIMSHLLSAKSRLKEEGLLDPSKRRAMEAKADRATQEKETQYLEKRLERHYTAMKNFIRTRAEPTIFYLPKKHTSKTQSRLDETKEAVDQKIKALKVHLRATSYDPLEDTKVAKEEHTDAKEAGKTEDGAKAEAKNGKADEKKEEKKDAQSGSESEAEDKDKDKAKADAGKKADVEEEEPKRKSKSRSASGSR